MNDAPAAKIKMMKASIRCLVFGTLGLLPVIGLPFAFASLYVAGKVRKQEKLFWNPAKPYRIWGVVCAGIGAVIWIVADTLIVLQAIDIYIRS
jgi:hypothetical protein